MLAKLLDLAGQALGKELNKTETRFWFANFERESPAALEWAFQQFFLGEHVDRYGNASGDYFPKFEEIAALLNRYRRMEADARRCSEQQAMLDDMRQARAENEARGEPVGLEQVHAILKQGLERIKKFP